MSKYYNVQRVACILIFFSLDGLSGAKLLGVLTVPFGITLKALASAVLIASLTLLHKGLFYNFLNMRAISWFGLLSYSLYVWQQPFLSPGIFDSKLGVFPWNILTVLALATVSYYLVELPSLKLRKIWIKK